MDDPAILAYGAMYIGLYDPSEYHGTLRRAFIDNHADFITLDSHPVGQRYLAACTAWAVEKGYLYCDRIETGQQEQVASFRLTPEGTKWLFSVIT